MLKKIINRRLKDRHYWRAADFDELSELYISNFFRGLSISLIGLFVPVYMLRLHYSVASILFMVAWYFTVRSLISDLAAGYSVAKIGPKHALLAGYFLQLISAALFLTLPCHHWPLWLLGAVWGTSYSYFFIPFNVSFSKVKHKLHAGKEMGYVFIMSKLGEAIGPLLGAVIATVFGAQYIFLAAGILLLTGAVPLFLTAEPVRLNQHLDFRSFRVNGHLRDYVSFCFLGMENSICLVLWPLFLGLFILSGTSVYAKLGVLSSVSVIVSIISAHLFGRRIDHKRGREMLRFTASVNALLHIIRPFVGNYIAAFGVNLTNEAVTSGYRMPYFKGMFEAADDLPGYRIVYLSSMEMISSTSKAAMWWVLFLIASVFTARTATTCGFMIAAVASILLMSERFKALDVRGHTG